MSFLKHKFDIKISGPYTPQQGAKVQTDLEKIIKNLSPEEISLLARATENQGVKALAIAQLRKMFN